MIDFKADEKFENTPISQLTVKEFRGLMESILNNDRRKQAEREMAIKQANATELRGGWHGHSGAAYG